MSLTDYIQEQIRDNGPISFHDFMEIALYHPEDGYYTSPEDKIGKEGDYYTSPWLTPLFGEMLGKQLEDMWTIGGKGQFKIIEYGAGTGAQCSAIMNYLKQNEEFYKNLEYCIIEKNTSKLPASFDDNSKIKIIGSIKDISPFTGCVLANEVLDNFPVHVVEKQESLMEVYVDYKDGFYEELRPAGNQLKEYFQELDVELPKGFRTEINLQAIQWLKDISESLEKGFILTIDYGFLSEDLYNPSRSKGTLLCYHRHRINDQPFNFIGEQDITAHVNFSALAHWGRKFDLHPLGYSDQSTFLLALGLTSHLRNIEIRMSNDPSSNKEDIFRLYKFLADMGKKFRVLIQEKGMPNSKLMGMQFANVI